jgi:predicted membrane protein
MALLASIGGMVFLWLTRKSSDKTDKLFQSMLFFGGFFAALFKLMGY